MEAPVVERVGGPAAVRFGSRLGCLGALAWWMSPAVQMVFLFFVLLFVDGSGGGIIIIIIAYSEVV